MARINEVSQRYGLPIDPQATPLLARRMAQSRDLVERLLVWMTLADDRAVGATYVLGKAVPRPAPR